MMTYAVYNFILFGTTISAYLYENSTSKNMQRIFLLFTFFIPLFFLCIRYNIGTDYHNYVSYFNMISNGEIVPKEPGYIFINWLIAYLGLDVQWVFVFFGFFTMFFLYKSFPKKGFALLVYFFITAMYLYEGFSAIRQGLAIAIMAYALKYIYEDKFFLYLFWAIIAMLFHFITGIILLLLYPIIKINFNRFFLIIFIVFSYILIIKLNFLQYLLNLIPVLFPKYAWYLHSKFMRPAEISSGLGVLLKILIAIVVIFFKNKIVENFKYAVITINLYVLYVISLMLHLKLAFFMRLEHVFLIFSLFSIVYFINTFEKNSKILVGFFFMSLFYVFFIKYIVAGTLANDNDVYINPYQTIFQRNK